MPQIDINIQETDWYKSRPASVQARIDTHPPNLLYRNKKYTGDIKQIVYLYSYEESEDGSCDTCQMVVSRKYNPYVFMERRVFGVPFDDLEMLSLEEEELLSRQESA